MKRFFLLCLLLLTLVSCSKQYYRVQVDGVEFHKGSDDKSEVVFTLDEGAVVYGRFEHDGWCQVHNNLVKEQRGWVKTDYLASITEAEADSLMVLAEAKMQEDGGQLNEEDKDRKTGLVFKAAHHNLMYFIYATIALGLVLLVLLWRQQSKRHFIYVGFVLSFILPLVIVALAGVYITTGSGRPFYNLLPLSFGLLILYPIYYTNIPLKGIRWLLFLLVALMLPLSFMLYADHQDGFFAPTLIWWAINAFVFIIYYEATKSNKCPYCRFFANQTDAGERFVGVLRRGNTTSRITGGNLRETGREYEGGHLKKIIMTREGQVKETTSTSWLVDVFSVNCCCRRCGTKYRRYLIDRNARDYQTSSSTKPL